VIGKLDDNLLLGFSDTSFGDDPLDGKSTTGGLVLCLGSAISWFSRKQTLVSLSTAESELVALCSCVCEIIWLVKLVKGNACRSKLSD